MKKSFWRNFLGILPIGFALHASAPQINLQLGAYYENWSQYRTTNPNNPQKGVFPSCVPQGFSLLASKLNILNYAFWIFNYNDQPPQGQTSPIGVTGDWKIYPTEWNDITPWGDGGLLGQAADLKKFNSNLKIMASIGGWNFVNNQCDGGNSYGCKTYQFFSDLLSDATNGGPNYPYTTAFINSLIDPQTGYFFLKTPQGGNYYLDGIDIDYEYPGQEFLCGTGENPAAGENYQGFIDFITKLRTAINTINATGQRPPLYLSITLPPFLPSTIISATTNAGTYPPGTPLAGKNYPAIAINPDDPSTYFAWYSIVANHCDWVNLMAYDMYGAGFSNSLVQYQCPLYNTNTRPYNSTTKPDDSKDGAHSVDYAVWMWTTGAKDGSANLKDYIGIAPGRIQLGLPAYGRSYGSSTFTFPANPILQNYGGNQGGFPQQFTQQAGTAAYFEITPLLGNALKMSSNSNPLTSLGSSPDQAQSFLVANSTKNTPPNNVFVYDAAKDIAAKVAYASQQGLGGVFFYAISEDNFPINSVSTTGYDPSNTLFKIAADAIAAPKGNLGGSQNISTRTPNQ